MVNQELEFHILDVFAESKFAGNQLAVVMDASRLSSSKMQSLAREFHFSETTFITSKGNNRIQEAYSVRIFTPEKELPFAGHPTLGTAFAIQQFIIRKKVPKVTLHLKVGKIPVTFNYDSRGKPGILWMRQNEPTFGSGRFAPTTISNVLGIGNEGIDARFPIQEVSTGVPFIIVPLRSLEWLKRCRTDRRAYFELVEKTSAKSILVFSPEAYKKGSDLAVRVFTEYYGIPEDPATGSGNGCLAAYLSKQKYFGKSSVKAAVDQGYEIARPSKLYLETVVKNGSITVSVGGKVVSVAHGSLQT